MTNTIKIIMKGMLLTLASQEKKIAYSANKNISFIKLSYMKQSWITPTVNIK